MNKVTVETLLKIKSIIKVNKPLDNGLIVPGEYVINEMVINFDKPSMKLVPDNVTYFLENLSNSNRDDCIYESDLRNAIATGDAEILNDDVVCYKVTYSDLTDKQERVDYVYVKAGYEDLTAEYFEKRVEKKMDVESTDPIKLFYHEIKVTSFEPYLR